MGYSTSYDLMVFEPDAAPKVYAEFLRWFAEQMECNEGHGYANAAEASELLRGWLTEMLQIFPSGADQLEEDGPVGLDEDRYSGYSVGRQMIYVIFVPSESELARCTAFTLAEKFGLGLFEPSSAGAEVWRPEEGKLLLVHRKDTPQKEPTSLWKKLAGKTKADLLPKPRLPEWMS